MSSSYTQAQQQLATEVLAAARARGMMVTTAESCTGGLIAGALTEIAGSSDVFDRGFIVYSYDAKSDILGVNRQTLTDRGAVSAEIAAQMADGALKASGAQIAVAVTGIAGPGGATPDKPVGLVYIGVAMQGTETRTYKNNFDGDRAQVRASTVTRSLELLESHLRGTTQTA